LIKKAPPKPGKFVQESGRPEMGEEGFEPAFIARSTVTVLGRFRLLHVRWVAAKSSQQRPEITPTTSSRDQLT
jgi:hypothetical protein